MSRSHHHLATVLADLLCLLAALAVAGAWHLPEGGPTLPTFLKAAVLGIAFSGLWLLISSRLGVYQVAPRSHLPLSLRRVTEAWAATWGIAGLAAVSTVDTDLAMWPMLLLGLGLLLLVRCVLSVTPLGASSFRPRTLIVGACASSRALSTRPASDALEIVGVVPFLGERASDVAHLPDLGPVQNLAEIVSARELDMVMICPSDVAVTGDIHRVFRVCDRFDLPVQFFPQFLDVDHHRIGLAWAENRPGLLRQPLQQSSLSQVVKRGIDIVGAAVGLIVLTPFCIASAIAVKLNTPGPVFFRQVRVGKGGREFRCFKFRSMRVEAEDEKAKLMKANEQDGPAFKMENDPRVTAVGRILRKFSIDEIPQLFNVLLGDMSLVGPRPPVPKEVADYTWWQRRRISVTPGMTGVWQVYGRGQRVSFKRWVEMDLFYIDNWSLWLDLKLMAHTIRVVWRGTGT
jgi:exopolysaccharide biosynthesis polyprenyl glycosylphosphotransferase